MSMRLGRVVECKLLSNGPGTEKVYRSQDRETHYGSCSFVGDTLGTGSPSPRMLHYKAHTMRQPEWCPIVFPTSPGDLTIPNSDTFHRQLNKPLAMSLPFTPLFIDGVWRPASSSSTYDVRNPFSGEVVGTAASASAEDCAAAVEAAARAFPVWERTPASVRRDIFLRAADLLATERYKEKIALSAREEVAGTDDMMPFSYYGQINLLRSYASLNAQLKGETFESVLSGGRVFAQRRAIGVVYVFAAPIMPSQIDKHPRIQLRYISVECAHRTHSESPGSPAHMWQHIRFEML